MYTKKMAAIVLALLVVVFAAYLVLSKARNSNNKSPTNQSVTPANGTDPPVNQSTLPGGSAPPSNLEECLFRANNSDAQQTIIEGFREACYRKYQ